MTFINSLEKDEYEEFVSSHPLKAHFMQSVGWGEFNRIERNLTPYYVGMRDEGEKMVAAALLLERKPLLFPPYIYSPRGFVIDFFNKQLLKSFCEKISEFCKEKGVMFLKIDPDIELCEIDEDGEQIDNQAKDNSFLVGQLKEYGFRHLGFNKEFEGRQPRYTFRIDLTGDENSILENIRGNVLKNVRKCEKNYDTEVYVGDIKEIEVMYQLIKDTSVRDDFFCFSEQFYSNFYEVLNSYGMVKLYIGKVNIKGSIYKLNEQLMTAQKQLERYTNQKRIDEVEATKQRLLKELGLFNGYLEKYGEESITSTHMVVNYANRAWAVHAGSSDYMNETFINNRVYLYKILDQKTEGAVFLDQFGTVGSFKDSKHRSLHEFKRQFGGRYIEFLGEFDMVFKPFCYNLYIKILPKYRSILFDLKKLFRKEKKNR